jgi:hypothetical protein
MKYEEKWPKYLWLHLPYPFSCITPARRSLLPLSLITAPFALQAVPNHRPRRLSGVVRPCRPRRSSPRRASLARRSALLAVTCWVATHHPPLSASRRRSSAGSSLVVRPCTSCRVSLSWTYYGKSIDDPLWVVDCITPNLRKWLFCLLNFSQLGKPPPRVVLDDGFLW